MALIGGRTITDKLNFSAITPSEWPAPGHFIVGFDTADDFYKKMDSNGVVTIIGDGVGGGGDPFYVELTAAALNAAKTGGTLEPGATYKITSYTEPVLVVATSVRTLSSEGLLEAKNADYQLVGNYSGVVGVTTVAVATLRGQWKVADSPIYALGDIVIYNSIHYQLTTPANKNGLPPVSNPTAYTALSKSGVNQGYITQIDNIRFNSSDASEANWKIVYREDGIRGNSISDTPTGPYVNLGTFQWGNNSVNNVECIGGATINCLNNCGTISGVRIYDAIPSFVVSQLLAANNCGNVSDIDISLGGILNVTNATDTSNVQQIRLINGGTLDCSTNSGAVTKITIDSATTVTALMSSGQFTNCAFYGTTYIVTIPPTSIVSGQFVNGIESTFTKDVTATVGNLDLGLDSAHCGYFKITSVAGAITTLIGEMGSSPRRMIIYPAPGVTAQINHGTGVNQIRMIQGANVVLNGTAGDSIVVEKRPGDSNFYQVGASQISINPNVPKMYRVKLTQDEVAAPSVAVLQDEVTGVIASRVGVGDFRLTKVGAFAAESLVHAKINSFIPTAKHPSFSGFNTTLPNSKVKSILVHTTGSNQGKMIVGGTFNYYGGNLIGYICRINLDGSLDTTFNNPLVNAGFNGEVTSMTFNAAETKIVVVGSFTTYNGVSQTRIVQLNANDGSVDGTFTTLGGFDATPNVIVRQADGKYLVGGLFTAYDINPSSGVARLNVNGSYDATYDVSLGGIAGGGAEVHDIVVQPDTSVILVGSFATYNGSPADNVVRTDALGAWDVTLVFSDIFNGIIKAVALDASGNIYLGGNFTLYDGSYNRILKVNSLGTTDGTFATGTGFDAQVEDIYVESGGNVVVVGAFANFNATSRHKMVRLTSLGAIDSTFVAATSGTGGSQTVLKIVRASYATFNKYYFGGEFNIINNTSLVSLFSGFSTRFFVRTSLLGVPDVRLTGGVMYAKIKRFDANSMQITTDNGAYLYDGILYNTEVELIVYPALT